MRRSGARVRKNPEDSAAERYEVTHGKPPDKIFEFSGPVHEHGVLAGIGDLEQLAVLNLDGDVVILGDFGDGIVSENEDGTQLFLAGGDQGVDLFDFGIEGRDAHEKELLGTLAEIWYFTTKVHLRDEDGGTAVYHHIFGGRGRRRPVLVYDTVNERIEIVGGDYSITPEGILE
jgi:hypothetical protein